MKNTLSYWKRYDLVFKHFSFKTIFNEILNLVKNLGKPFRKKSNKGRPFKIKPEKYAAYIAFETVTHNSPYRDMELGSELYLGEHIDHSTFGKNFQRIPYRYFLKLLERVGRLLEELLGKACLLIADSTGTHSHIYYDCDHKGKESRRKKIYKTHSLVSSHPEKSIVYIRTGLGSDKKISDSEGARRMLEKESSKGTVFIADRGYDYEKVYRICSEKGIIANIKQQKYKSGRSKKRELARACYDGSIYRQKRGVVETIFGGLRNKGLLDTKYRKDENINKHSILALFRHNLFTLLRTKVNLYLKSLFNRQTLFNLSSTQIYLYLTKMFFLFQINFIISQMHQRNKNTNFGLFFFTLN